MNCKKEKHRRHHLKLCLDRIMKVADTIASYHKVSIQPKLSIFVIKSYLKPKNLNVFTHVFVIIWSCSWIELYMEVADTFLSSNSFQHYYNLINNFSIIACGARCARSFATAYLLTGAQHTLRAGIFRVDRSLFHQIIKPFVGDRSELVH